MIDNKNGASTQTQWGWVSPPETLAFLGCCKRRTTRAYCCSCIFEVELGKRSPLLARCKRYSDRQERRTPSTPYQRSDGYGTEQPMGCRHRDHQLWSLGEVRVWIVQLVLQKQWSSTSPITSKDIVQNVPRKCFTRTKKRSIVSL